MSESGLKFAEGIDPRFPREKLKVAQGFLCAFNPWWYRYTGRITIKAFDGTKSTGDVAGTMRLVDLDLWVETHFALEASVEELAGQFRRTLISSVRNVDLRLSHCQTRQERELRNVALQLEITSVADEEAEALDKLTPHEIQVIVDRSYTFTRTAMSKYGVTGVPSDTSGVWRPEDFGWPRGLSAEDYYRKLKDNDPTGEPPPEESGEEGDQGDSDSEKKDGQSQESENKDSSDEASDDDSSESKDEEESNQESEDTGDSDSQESPEEGAEKDDNEAEDEESSSDSSEDNGEPADEGSESDSSSDSNSDEEQDSSEDGSESDSGGEGSESSENNPDSSSEEQDQTSQESQPGEQSGGQGGSPMAQDAMKEQMKADGQKNWTARDFREPDPEESDYTAGDQKEEALQELTEDMLNAEATSLASWGIAPGNSFVQYVYERQRKGPQDWKKRIGTPIVNSMKSAQIRGMSDMSYTRRNPHQPEFGPIMPGMIGSTPSMVIVLDVSGSMRGSLTEMFDSLNAIMRHMSTTYRTKCTWITADTVIMNVGTGSTLSQKVIDDATSRGFGGTVTGPIIEELATKQVIHEGRKIKAPDVLAFITDGIGQRTLPWPDAEKLPRSKSRLIIGRVLPSWLRLGGEDGLPKPHWATEKNWIDLSVLQEKRSIQSIASLGRTQ